MKNRRSIFLLIVGIVLLGAANVLLRHETRVAGPADHVVLADLQSAVHDIRISPRGRPEIRLTGVSGTWRLVSPYAAGADVRVVMRLLDQLSQVPVVEVLSDSALLRLGRTRADFQLEEAPLSLGIDTESGESRRYSFGALTPAKDGVYAAVDGVDAVFIVRTNLVEMLNLPPESFRRRSLFVSGADCVNSFEIRRENSPILEFSNGENGWQVGSRRAADQKITKFISDLTSVTASSFVWPVGASNESDHVSSSLLAGYGLDPDSAVTVTLNSADGTVNRVSFGKESGDDRVYALVQNGDAVVTVPRSLKDFAAQETLMFADTRVFPVDARSVGFFSLLENGCLYSLARGTEGVWKLESPIVAPADQDFVETVVARIVALSSVDIVSDNGISVSVSTNFPKVLVGRECVLAGKSFEDLRSREMLRIDPTLVRRIVSLRGDGKSSPDSVVYERTRREWCVENTDRDARVNVKGVEALLAAVCPLKAARVVKLNVPAADLDEYGLGTPSLTVALDQNAEDAVRRNILIGKKTRGGRFATIGSSDAVFVISEQTYLRLATPIVEK